MVPAADGTGSFSWLPAGSDAICDISTYLFTRLVGCELPRRHSPISFNSGTVVPRPCGTTVLINLIPTTRHPDGSQLEPPSPEIAPDASGRLRVGLSYVATGILVAPAFQGYINATKVWTRSRPLPRSRHHCKASGQVRHKFQVDQRRLDRVVAEPPAQVVDRDTLG